MINDERRSDGGDQAERFWEGRYRAHERVWSGRANPVLVDVAGSLLAGAALDLGCGEGGVTIIPMQQVGGAAASGATAAAMINRALLREDMVMAPHQMALSYGSARSVPHA